MVSLVVMACGMLVLGIVAATNVSTGQTHPQVDPMVSCFKAIFATIRGRGYIGQICQMFAVFRVDSSVFNPLVNLFRNPGVVWAFWAHISS
jgi:hypothetical protein